MGRLQQWASGVVSTQQCGSESTLPSRYPLARADICIMWGHLLSKLLLCELRDEWIQAIRVTCLSVQSHVHL